jgi:8-oxo-dGTP pyrophosphatase MutT (NUDIX family)
MLETLYKGIELYSPRIIDQPKLAQAAVLIALTDDNDNPELILTQRSKDMPSHSGEVAFPGGKADAIDRDAIDTALRETHEEVGIAPALVSVIGQMDQVVSRFGYLVTPIIGVVPKDVELIPDPRELSSVFRVPLRYFIDETPRTDQFGEWFMPAWHYQGYRIWGLTAMIISEMLNGIYDTDIKYSRFESKSPLSDKD